jgi:hypothetical protein
MSSKTLKHGAAGFAQTVFLIGIALAATHLHAQAPANRYLGTVTAISGDTLSVKTDAGDVRQVEVPSTAVLKRVAPGQKDLSAAVDMQFADLATGDRVLVRLDANAAGPTPQAVQIVAIKQTDVAEKQQKEREDWQQRGVGGLVKSVDAAPGVIVLTSGAGPTAKTVTVKVSKATILKRYAPASVRFDLAQAAPIDAIHAGDQLRARGQKNADGTQMDAEEIVSGSFRNISGTITSLDATAQTLLVKDLIAKKPVTIHITGDVQMRELPEMMARMLAARLKGTSGNGAAAPGAQAPAGQGGAQHSGGGPQGGGWTGQRSGANGGGGGDMQQVLSRAPAIQLADLKKGEAVMLVATEGASEVTAITLLAGVEPLLEAPAASQDLLSNWSMGSGGAAEAAAQ